MALAVLMTVSVVPANVLAADEYVSDSVGIPGISTYADNPDTVEVGKTITIKGGGQYSRNHNWSATSKDGGKVNFTTDTNNYLVKVEGVTAGLVTITHTYGSWPMSNSEYFDITVTDNGQYTVTYNLNGGNGTVPEDVKGSSGDIINLPGGDGISRGNYELLGWSESNDANTVSDGKSATIYSLGGEYEITSNKTLYAVWGQNSGTRYGKIVIAIRTDGVIPDEPTIRYEEVYDYLPGINNGNVLDYFSPAHTVSGKENVSAALTQKFYEYVDENKGDRWDDQTEYVEWYVIKYQSNNGGEWHIDGVIREKSKVNLDYNGNGNTGGLAPDGKQYTPGSSATVEGNTNNLVKVGYDFDGWNTKADGTGTSYKAGDSIAMNKDITLYAKWKPKNSTKYVVQYYWQNVDDEEYSFHEKEEKSGRTNA